MSKGLNEPLTMIWNPPLQARIQDSSSIPRMTTLLKAIDQPTLDPDRKTIAVNLITSVYTLLESRWYHKNLNLNNIVSFNNNWTTPYIVGFRTSRSANGLSDPLERKEYEWIERYYQHPERWNGKKPRDVHYLMKLIEYEIYFEEFLAT
jgi:hypothetical protein